MGFTWFVFPCLCLAIASFGICNCDRKQKALTSSTWFALALFSLPLGYMDQFLFASHELIRSLSINLLRWQTIPHVDLIASIGFPSGRLYIADQLQSWLSWPLFFSAAMVYSAAFKRSVLVTGCNFVLSYVAFILFHVGIAFFVGAYDIATRPVWQVWQMTVPLGLLSFLFFVSAERGIRCLLAPISDEIGGSQQINPVVAAWNYIQGFDAYRSQERRKKRSFVSSKAFPIAFTLSIILLGSQGFVVKQLLQTPNAAELSIDRDQFSDILSSETIVDHRRVSRVVLPEQGVVSDVWTTYLPSRTTQFSLLFEPTPHGNLARLYTASGWRVDDEMAEAADESASAVALLKEGVFGRLMWAYVTYDGKLLPASTNTMDLNEPLITVQCMAAILEDPSRDAEQQIQKEFLQFSASVANKLNSQ